MLSNKDSINFGLIDRLTHQLNGDRAKALAILRQRGHVYGSSEELTPEGKIRDQMGAEQRALDRTARYKGYSADQMVYDENTNRVKRRHGK